MAGCCPAKSQLLARLDPLIRDGPAPFVGVVFLVLVLAEAFAIQHSLASLLDGLNRVSLKDETGRRT